MTLATNEMSHEEWLEIRKKSIGGSDAATILGLNPYESPYSLWAYKTGKTEDKEDNEAMRQGRDLEDYVAQRFCEATGKKVRRKNQMLYNDKYPWSHANIDRDVVGENAGLECKTTSTLNMRQFKNGEYPDTYYCQCIHYMAITGADKWYLAVLVLGRDFMYFEIPRNEDEIEALMAAEERFMNDWVKTDSPPPVDGREVTSEALKTVFADVDHNLGTVQLFGRESIIKDYIDLGGQIKALEKRREYCKQLLQEDLGASEYGETNNTVVSWKQQVRRAFDSKAFLSDHPEAADDKYYKSTQYRVFKIKEVGEIG